MVPNLAILCDKSKFSERGYKSAPELIVEVLSKSTAKKDKNEKLLLYEKFGVKEYWLVDKNNKSIEQRIFDKKYKLIGQCSKY